jgi:uncharacterized protein (DUF2252 family)
MFEAIPVNSTTGWLRSLGDSYQMGRRFGSAARGSDLSGVTTATMMEQMMVGYQEALITTRRVARAGGDDLTPIKKVLKQAHRRRWQHLAEERIEDVKPQIPLGRRFWTLADSERQDIATLFSSESVITKILAFKGRDAGTKVKVVDAAYWMKGCSSLGRLRFAVLLGVGHRRDREYGLIDLKEATTAVAPRAKEFDGDPAERVVMGARQLSPYLGERMMAVKLASRPIVMRELMPQDLKFELAHLTRDEAVAAARYLAAVVGNAHGRQMSPRDRRLWRGELRKHRAKHLDAPHWLWKSVVALIDDNEAAYLEHCRRYAMAG